MKKYVSQGFIILFIITTVVLSSLTGLNKNASAKVEWELLEKIALDDIPNDIAISSKGETAYILGTDKILIYSTQENKVTDTIPITGKFSQIAVSADGEKLFLTGAESKQLAIMKVNSIYDIHVGQSPVIGKLDAPVSVVAFLDYQCPYCAKVYPVLEQVLDKYPEEVNLIIKHYPLSMHRFARKASLAALAASKQNTYPEITKVLTFGSISASFLTTSSPPMPPAIMRSRIIASKGLPISKACRYFMMASSPSAAVSAS